MAYGLQLMPLAISMQNQSLRKWQDWRVPVWPGAQLLGWAGFGPSGLGSICEAWQA